MFLLPLLAGCLLCLDDTRAPMGHKMVLQACKLPPFCWRVRQTLVSRLLLLSSAFPIPSLTATQGGALALTVRLANVALNCAPFTFLPSHCPMRCHWEIV